MIGISGIAGSGKDLFCKFLLKEIKGSRIALADPLKEETRGFILQKYGIDILNCGLEEKNKVRDLLVFYGGIKRYESKGTYWTDRAQKKVNDCKHVPIVTDIRYAEYQNDEIHWLKAKNKGTLIHLRKYCEVETFGPQVKRVYFDPPNEDEKRNDPKIRDKADYCIEWPHIENANYEKIKEVLSPYAKEFAEWYKMRKFQGE
jgi:hypothetical protein|tara:strand:- start:1577 stop:2182 length:606 start_codon:yes stop_codon:yes gene_type:complete